MGRNKDEFDRRTYFKVVQAAEFYLVALERMNLRVVSPDSLKGSKDLLKIAYGIRHTPLVDLKGEGGKNKAKNFRGNQEIIDAALRFEKNSHEFLAYRMALGLPTPFTPEEHRELNKLTTS